MSLGHKSQSYCQRIANREHPQPAWLSLWTWGLVQQRSVTRSRPDQASEEGVSEMVDVHNTDPPELKENRTVKDKQFPGEDESIIK